jgi:hypothetical protein
MLTESSADSHQWQISVIMGMSLGCNKGNEQYQLLQKPSVVAIMGEWHWRAVRRVWAAIVIRVANLRYEVSSNMFQIKIGQVLLFYSWSVMSWLGPTQHILQHTMGPTQHILQHTMGPIRHSTAHNGSDTTYFTAYNGSDTTFYST